MLTHPLSRSISCDSNAVSFESLERVLADTWIVIPSKQWTQSKQRLSALLNIPQRKALSKAMLQDMLEQISLLPVGGIVIVGPNHQCCEIKKQFDVIEWVDDADCHDLNASLKKACQYARANNAKQLALLHADLATITAQSISELLLYQNQFKTVCLVSDQIRVGTNALVFDADTHVDLYFGENSLSRHSQWLHSQSIQFEVLDSFDSIEFDVDTVKDFWSLKQKLYQSQYAYAHHCLDFFQHSVFDYSASLPDRAREQFLMRVNNESNTTEESNQPISIETFENTASAQQLIALSNRLQNQQGFDALLALSRKKRDQYWTDGISYSPKVFLPVTHLCRDVCHYCTFAKHPRELNQLYMTEAQVLEQTKQAQSMGCREALLTLGEKPELKYPQAKQWLRDNGFETTVQYVAYLAKRIVEETQLLPHINAGCLSEEEYQMLKPYSASMGLMLESSSERLCEKGQVHYGSPDKHPSARLQSIELAGEAKVPFTSGILIGIGETRLECLQSILDLKKLHEKYGHLQEVIVQNFRAKADTKLHNTQEPSLQYLQWAIAMARLILPEEISVQAPPNLSANNLSQLLESGINDWGGVSPMTIDFVNPEAAWPSVQTLTQACEQHGKALLPRLTVYPEYIRNLIDPKYIRFAKRKAQHINKKSNDEFIAPSMHASILNIVDAQGWAKEDDWQAGIEDVWHHSAHWPQKLAGVPRKTHSKLNDIFEKIDEQELLTQQDIVELFSARGQDFLRVCHKANTLREKDNGDAVSYVLNRNINYTNICTYSCHFCAFSKGTKKHEGKEAAYNLDIDTIVARAQEAWDQGATEVCLQGGIHPSFTGEYYLDICRAIRQALPNMHIHAFSPLEVTHGAQSLGLDVPSYLRQLKAAGLNTLPGTAAEILDDEVRQIICADKIDTNQWLHVMRSAHQAGVRSTATIMFGHVDQYHNWARHLMAVRDLQIETQGFTEFVPLPFVASQSPMFLRGQSRRGPSLRESVLMHAVARLVLSPWINNIQTSWVKMGQTGVSLCLQAGANDLGGNLMNESITRAAGAKHGQSKTKDELEQMAHKLNRQPCRRSTLYDLYPAQPCVFKPNNHQSEIRFVSIE